MTAQYLAIVPIVCVWLGGVAAMLAEAFRSPGERMPIGGLGIIGLVASLASSLLLWNRGAQSFGVVSADNFGLFVTVVLAVVGILTIALSHQIVERDGIPAGEFYALLLFSLGGMMLMAVANDLLIIFIALEILSLAIYILTAIRRDVRASTEAAFKYFLLGGFSSAFFLYGIAFTFGVAGSTRLDRIVVVMAGRTAGQDVLTYLALGLLLVGFAFKVSAVPFHMWTPDAYEGAPPVVTAFMSAGVKAAAFAAFVRVFMSAFGSLQPQWAPLLWALAALSMVLGVTAGVVQTKVRRMLAYSSIAHAGYLLMAMTSGNNLGKGAVLFYLLTYALTSVGAFGVTALVATRDRANDDLADYAGLGRRQPMLAFLMTVFLLSLGGFPPTAGFVGKWYLFASAVSAGNYALAIIGVLTSVVSVFFYLRVVVMMYMSDDPSGAPVTAPSAASLFALGVPMVAILYLGILPTRLLDLAARSIATIL
ncbi:MAG TPA: NADH-quinone oxidoreductase subunit N [Vicinamibacterales bacterium]|jgi:NADH-quinone oxidoreductase subunit N|nr:NADH-quinone oxidoreductase subunit N [Vicinamibacterales bacterium]